VAKTSSQKAQSIRIDLIDEPAYQVRMDIPEEGIQELADSIKVIGQLQPVLVRPVEGRYEVVFGHRRLLACKRLGLEKIQAVVRKLDDQAVALMRATENIARQDVSPIEEAAVYADLRDTHGLRIDEIARRMGKSEGIIKRRLDLLKMPPQLQKAIHEKKITYGVAEELWRLGDPGDIDYYLAFAVEHGCTVAVARQWVNDHKKAKRAKEGDIGGGTETSSPMEARPVWVTCDLCLGPMELGKETVFRACPGCTETIRKSLVH